MPGRPSAAVLPRMLVLALLLCAAAPALAAGFDPVAATNAYLKTLPAAARAKSDAYFEGGYWLILWTALYSMAVCLLLLASGLSARMRDAAFAVTGRRIPAIALYAMMFSLSVAVLTFPLDVYQGFFREHAYGLSNQSFAGWLHDDAVGDLVSVIAAACVLPVIYAVIRAAPRHWWLWGSFVVAGFLIVFTLAGPVFLEPLFNDFKPLPSGPLRERILSMARSDGVPAHDVMQFDNSRQTNRVSAHVSGLFGTTQIALNDNLLQQCTPDEVAAVLGHEMGHYVLNHAFVTLLCVSAIITGGFASAQRLFATIVRRFGARWRLQGIDDPAGLPVLAAILTLYMFVLTPVLNSLTRMQEVQADIFGLNLARRPDAFATVALKLSTYRKLDPSWLEEIMFFDHPSGRARILSAMRWKAEQ